MMKRKERTQILVHCRGSFLRKWAKRLEEEAEMKMIEEPSMGLVMIQMRESGKQSLFYPGEILVSEAKVECKGIVGIGILNGNELQKAYDLAVIDAAYGARLAPIQDLEKDLMKEQKRQMEQKKMQMQKILETKVNFETMDV